MRIGSRSAGKTRERYQPSDDLQPSTWPLMLLNRGDSQSATQQASQDWSVPPVRIETYAGFHRSPAPLPGLRRPTDALRLRLTGSIPQSSGELSVSAGPFCPGKPGSLATATRFAATPLRARPRLTTRP